MHRLYVAIRPPSTIRAQLLDLMDGIESARWQDDDQLHLTLRFIGEVDSHTANDVAAALVQIRHGLPPLRLDGVGRFDTRGKTNAIWAGVSPREPLTALHRKLDQAMIRIGLPAEPRAYLPHITLARLSGSAGPVDGFLARHAGLTSSEFSVDTMVLYESSLGKSGSIYTPVERYRLTGG